MLCPYIHWERISWHLVCLLVCVVLLYKTPCLMFNCFPILIKDLRSESISDFNFHLQILLIWTAFRIGLRIGSLYWAWFQWAGVMSCWILFWNILSKVWALCQRISTLPLGAWTPSETALTVWEFISIISWHCILDKASASWLILPGLYMMLKV